MFLMMFQNRLGSLWTKIDELFDKYKKICDEYFEEGKHRDSLQHLRALLFFLQRQEHFSGPNDNYANEIINLVKDIRSLILQNQ